MTHENLVIQLVYELIDLIDLKPVDLWKMVEFTKDIPVYLHLLSTCKL